MRLVRFDFGVIDSAEVFDVPREDRFFVDEGRRADDGISHPDGTALSCESPVDSTCFLHDYVASRHDLFRAKHRLDVPPPFDVASHPFDAVIQLVQRY